jgi:hypothetical protein
VRLNVPRLSDLALLESGSFTPSQRLRTCGFTTCPAASQAWPPPTVSAFPRLAHRRVVGNPLTTARHAHLAAGYLSAWRKLSRKAEQQRAAVPRRLGLRMTPTVPPGLSSRAASRRDRWGQRADIQSPHGTVPPTGRYSPAELRSLGSAARLTVFRNGLEWHRIRDGSEKERSGRCRPMIGVTADQPKCRTVRSIL